MWQYFCLGLLVGWLLEWVIDWAFWRRPESTRERVPAGGAWGGPAVNAAAAGAAAGVPVGAIGGAAAYAQDDLEAIEGIGPKIAELLRANQIRDFAGLAAAPMADLVKILDAAGPNFRLANPGTWAEQAALAARGDWAAFERLRRELVAGVRVERPHQA